MAWTLVTEPIGMRMHSWSRRPERRVEGGGGPRVRAAWPARTPGTDLERCAARHRCDTTDEGRR